MGFWDLFQKKKTNSIEDESHDNDETSQELMFAKKFTDAGGKFIYIDKGDSIIDTFTKIKEYIEEYNVAPTIEAMSVISDRATESHRKLIQTVFEYEQEPQDLNWLVDETEKFCKDKAVFNAVLEGIQIIDGKSKDKSPDALPDLLTEALQVSFDKRIGHDFIEDADKRFEFYNKKETKVQKQKN